MKNLIIRFLSLFMIITMVVTVIPVSAFAENQSPIVKHYTLNYINPMYEQYADQTKLPTFNADVPVFDSSNYYSSIESAGKYMRDEMEARNTNICFSVTVDGTNLVFDEVFDALLNEAWKHTGVPTEGDYIHWQIISYGGNVATYQYPTYTTYEIVFQPSFFTTQSMEEVVDMYVDDCIELLKEEYGPFENNYQAVCAIYDFLRYYVDYDYDNLYNDSYYLKHSAYAAIVNGTSVCQGYALLFYRLALELDIDARFIGSIRSEQHCWNIVQLGNRYYNLDATWDDTKSSLSSCRWFLLGSDSFINDYGYVVHTRDAEYTTSAFNKAYPTSTEDFNMSDYEVAPTISGTVIASSGNPKISWTATPNTSKYQLYRSTTGKAGSFKLLTSTTKTSITNTSVTAGQTYYYKVRPIFTNGLKGEFSKTIKATAKLAAPTIKATNDTQSGKIKLSWNAVDGADKYEVYRSSSKNGTYTLLKTLSSTSLTNTSAVAGKTYYYKVRAINSVTSSANSAYSGIVYRTCDCAQPVVTVSNVTSTGKIKLKWNAVNGADKYEVYRSSSKNGTYTLLKTLSSTSLTNTSAVAGKTYYYKVRAIVTSTSAASSAYSEIVSRTCDCAQPVVTVSNVASTGKIKLNWNTVDGADKYEVYRSSSKNGTYTLLKTLSSTSLTNTSAVAGKTYYYKVRAINSSSSSATSVYSDIVSRTCDMPSPDLTVELDSDGKPRLRWTKIDGADAYEVYRSTSKNGTYKLLTTKTGTYVVNTSATSGQTYYYKVRAIDNNNTSSNSAYSNIVSITSK